MAKTKAPKCHRCGRFSNALAPLTKGKDAWDYEVCPACAKGSSDA